MNNTSRWSILLQKVYLDKSLILINSTIYPSSNNIKRSHTTRGNKLSVYSSSIRTYGSIKHFHTQKDSYSHSCSNLMMLFYKSVFSSSQMDRHNYSCNMCNLSPSNMLNKTSSQGMYNQTFLGNSIIPKICNTSASLELVREGSSSSRKNSHMSYLNSTSKWNTLFSCLVEVEQGIYSSKNHMILGWDSTYYQPIPKEQTCLDYQSCSNSQVSSMLDLCLCNIDPLHRLWFSST